FGGPILPGFVRPDGPVDDPIVYWSRNNLFDGGRIQGVFGDANSLAYVALLAIVVFALRLASQPPRRFLLGGWILVAAFLFYRAGSATAFLAAAGMIVVLGTALLMRTVKRPGGRTRYYVLYAVVGFGGLASLWLAREWIFSLLGRSA